ncbi:hypothetical protein CANARDRAFT_29620 [[Candida] arabinofermentans NRRL YB-2248]|uniref:AAA+ ATPase domain-containing protein n=1 Tax=[Candida] arabinofermentans NRRL YB-2248 TaxID=983967 RepID=A0A1E4SWL8_9ASCO|nr:hypothetical protein CANARDRAFT_29620 [[Candida] arabinofermentans NRRL YB-2248]
MAPKSSSSNASSTSSAKKTSTKGETPDSSKLKQPKLPTEFILRPSTNKSLNATSQIYISPRLKSITDWQSDNFMKLSKGLKDITCILKIWPDSDDSKYDLNVILISESFLKLSGFILGDRIALSKSSIQPSYATNITVEVCDDAEEEEESNIPDKLNDIGLLYNDLTFPNFKIQSMISIEDDLNDLQLDDETNKLKSNVFTPLLYHPKTTSIKIEKVNEINQLQSPYSFSKIGGLSKELDNLSTTISIPLNHPTIFNKFGIQPPRGILLTGNSGVGKSLIMKTIPYEFSNCHIININGPSIVSKYLGGTEEKLRSLFKEAFKYQPSIILIDEIDSLIPSRSNDDITEVDTRVIATLLMLIDELDGSIVVIGATNRPNSIDISFRRPGRFDKEIEIPIPDINSRYDILLKQFESITDKNHDLSIDQIKNISDKTHGYVGSDLISLCRESIMKCIFNNLKNDNNTNLKVTYDDFNEAMKTIKPSAMREIVLEMPHVTWDDIGGQEILKRKLKEMVQLPLIASETFKKLGISAPKGLLLYGPPGCSKTLTAKALASESGLNFLAIKGPEIFNKYVGESEKKIREIFKKARLSSPSIIFIDEIDALATNRESDDSNNVSKQVLNSMLNEIDGVEELKGVIIIGATNRPDSIDPALLRPGRLDRHVYVSPPDKHARLQILQKNTSKFNLVNKSELLNKLSDLTDGFSGSETVLLCQEAGLNAIMEDNNTDEVKEEHFTKALNDISKNITDEMLNYYREFGERYKAV